MTFKVDGADVRKTKAGKDYLALKIGDKTVSFFDAPDTTVVVKAGDTITCNLKQSGRFWNGKNLKVIDPNGAKLTPFPADQNASTSTPATSPSPAQAVAIETPLKTFTQPGELGQVVKAGSRTYFVDVKVSKAGGKYLSITESGGKDGEKRQIIVFPDHLDEFADAIEKARKAVKA